MTSTEKSCGGSQRNYPLFDGMYENPTSTRFLISIYFILFCYSSYWAYCSL